MFLFLIPILTSLLIVGSESRAQDDEYSAANQVYYTPYGPSNQYGGQQPYNQQPFGGQEYGGQQFDGQSSGQQAPCGRSNQQSELAEPPINGEDSAEEELNEKVGRETGVPLEPTGIDSQQPANDAVPEAPCDKPGSENMPLEVMCSLPPHKGTGDDDIFRYYYNPVVQLCIPFSYSGKGGNANRFVSVKNCYEICHPADPTVKKPRVVSGIKAYLVPNLKSDCKKGEKQESFDRQKIRQQPKEVVIRQIPHPLDPTKTLTIIQNAQYIPSDQLSSNPNGLPNSNSPNNQEIDPNVRRLYQYESVPQYISPYGRPYAQPYGQPYGRTLSG